MSHKVHICHNTGPGVRWTADDDAGFCGGSDSLQELVSSVQQWIEDEHLDTPQLLITIEPEKVKFDRFGFRALC